MHKNPSALNVVLFIIMAKDRFQILVVCHFKKHALGQNSLLKYRHEYHWHSLAICSLQLGSSSEVMGSIIQLERRKKLQYDVRSNRPMHLCFICNLEFKDSKSWVLFSVGHYCHSYCLNNYINDDSSPLCDDYKVGANQETQFKDLSISTVYK